MRDAPAPVVLDTDVASSPVLPWSGETVAVIAHGEHVADVVPSGEMDRLRETIEVFSDPDAMEDLQETEFVVCGQEAIQALIDERIAREGS